MKLRSQPQKNLLVCLRGAVRIEGIIIGILTTAAISLVLVLFIGEGLIHRDPPKRPEIPESMSLPPSPMEPAALAVLEAFSEAPDLVSKSRFVRDSARVRPMMEDYHERRGHAFPTLGQVSPGHTAYFNEAPMVLFEVEPFSGPSYPVAVVWDGSKFVVDWESLTAYGTIDWSEFVEAKPTKANTFRVYVRAAREADQLPGAADGEVTFHIEHRDDPEGIFALATVEISAHLGPLVEGKRVPVTLELAWKPTGPGGTPTPHIVSFIAQGWSP